MDTIWKNRLIIKSKTKTVMEATFKENKLHDLAHWGIRAAIGVIFVVHSIKKFDPTWQQWLVDMGLPPELQLPIALTEFLGGIFLITGILTRISASIISVILLGAIFYIRGLDEFFISKGGWEWDLVMLAGALSIIAAGPGRVSIAHAVKRIPRLFH